MLTNNYVIHAISVGAAIVASLQVSPILGIDQTAWMVLAAFLTSQTTRGTPLRQGMIFLSIIVFAVMLAQGLFMLKLPLLTNGMLAISYILSGYVVLNYLLLSNKQIFHVLLFVIVFMIATLPAETYQADLDQKLLAIVIGGAIGILFNQFVFSIRLSQSFCQSMVPMLTALREYSVTLTASIIHQKDSEELAKRKLWVEKSILSQYGTYPDWVYETGFNPGLRSGWRYFLVHIEQVVETYFALDFLAIRKLDVSPFADHLSIAMKKNEELISILIQYFSNQQIKFIISDFTNDLIALESELAKIIPNNIDFLDVSPNYIALTALVRDIRDLRTNLLKLVDALPG